MIKIVQTENLQDGLRDVSESVRQQLIILENIQKEIKSIQTGTKAEGMLKERLTEYIFTALTDLFILSDFLFEAESCNDESDFEFLLDVYDDKKVAD